MPPLANMNEPHHEVMVTYPSVQLLDENKDFHIIQPWNQSERYEPLPLVPDSLSSALYESENWRYTSVYPATLLPEGQQTPAANSEDFLEDMQTVIKLEGYTTLEMAAFGPGNPDTPEGLLTHIRIRRTTCFDEDQTSTTQWEILYHHLKELATTIPVPWMEHMMELLEQRTRRAARHVQRLLDVFELENPYAAGWKAPRGVLAPE